MCSRAFLQEKESSSYNGAIKVNQELVSIDPQVLFQRLVTAGMSNEQLPENFQFELSSYPLHYLTQKM